VVYSEAVPAGTVFDGRVRVENPFDRIPTDRERSHGVGANVLRLRQLIAWR
jgi:hypothetical protein